MRYRVLGALILSVAGLGATALEASDFWYRSRVDFYRNNCWPQPFQNADRELTRAPLIAMTAAGWRQNNTLSDHFFNLESQAINPAGEFKLRWIVTQAPMHRRTVFVLRGPTPQATQARVNAVHVAMDKMLMGEPRPEVLVTTIIPPNASGDYFDQVDRQLKESIPAPRLPAMESTSGDN
ncbi:MAG: hypothetical protein AB7F89_21120 [Pirellulaceae bacterium]